MLKNFFNPPAPKPLIEESKIKAEYKWMRLKVFLGAFLGYAAYYLVRKNMALASPGMQQSIENGGLGYDKLDIGIAMSAISIAYAFSKFLMGSLSDRSDARKFLVVGLILSSLVMMSVGIFDFATSSVGIMFVFMLVTGWLSGMGWPPCGRIMVYWFSQNERSFKMSIWNTSHTVGSGLLGQLAQLGMGSLALITIFGSIFGFSDNESWRMAFILPSIVALFLAIFCWWAIRDTPVSCGLPPIDEYRKDNTGQKTSSGDTKIPFKKLFIDYIFKNKILWLIALSNSFVYLVRYGVGDWSPTYLTEVIGMTKAEASSAFSWHNYAGIPGTIICGLISAKWFKGRCAPANVIYMALVLIGVIIYWQATSIATWLNISPIPVIYGGLMFIGFCIYGPVALIGVQAVNLVPRNAAGTAAGFVGLFGYLVGDAILAKILMGGIADKWGWTATFWMLILACVLSIIFCSTTWKSEKLSAK